MNQREKELKWNTKQILEEEELGIRMMKLKQENMKLCGEVEILRRNMIMLEKRNHALSSQRSKEIVNSLNVTDKLRKEVDVLRMENRIRENRTRTLKKQDVEPTIDIKWALSKANDGMNFSLFPFEFDRLKFMKDFFYPDFCLLDTNLIIREMNNKSFKFKEFLDLYVLFSCRVGVFKEFFCMVFINPAFPERKTELFNTLPLDWILDFRDQNFMCLVKEHVSANYEDALFFFLRVVEERPFLLRILLSKEVFTEIAKIDTKVAKTFISEVCKKDGLSFVDHTNIHLIPQCDLEVLYEGSYFEVSFT